MIYYSQKLIARKDGLFPVGEFLPQWSDSISIAKEPYPFLLAMFSAVIYV